MSYPITAFSSYASISDYSFPPNSCCFHHCGVFTFCQVGAQCVAGICVNFVATVFDNNNDTIIAIGIVLTFSASVSSFTVLSSFVSCFEIFGVFENSIPLTWSLKTPSMQFSDFLIFVGRLVKSSSNFEETITMTSDPRGWIIRIFLFGLIYWLLE